MKLVASELKKLSKNRIIFIIIAAFILLDVFNIYRNYNISNGVPDGVAAAQRVLQNQLDGEITEEKTTLINTKIDELTELVNGEFNAQKEPDKRFLSGYAFWDLQLWESYQNYIERASEYADNLEGKIETASDNIAYYKDRNPFYSAENELYFHTYSNRIINEIYDTDTLPDYFSYCFSSVLMVIVLLIGVVPVFCNECECDMHTVLLTSRFGRRRTINAKIFSSVIFTIAVSLLFATADFFAFWSFDGIDGLSAPLYAVQGYENTSLSLSVFQFCILLFIIKTVGILVVSLIFLLFSRLFKKSVVPFVCGLVTFFLLMMSKVFFTNQIGRIINLFNPITLLTSNDLFMDFNVLNVLGQPIFMWQFALFVGMLIVAALFSVIAFLPLKIDIKLRAKK